MRIRYAGTWDHRDYPHCLELLDLQDQLNRAALPAVQQVAYRKQKDPRQLCLRFKEPPNEGMELPIRAGDVTLAWLKMKHKSLNAKLIFLGLEEALNRCGYEVKSSIRANKGPIAMMVKFATIPTQPEWPGVKNADADESASKATDDLERIHAEKDEDGAFSPTDLDDARKRILAAIVVRQGQGAFREKLLAAYQSCCALTGCDVVEALEAAHVVPYLGPETNHTSNGLLLRADIHTLFDLSLMVLNPGDYRVVLSKRLKGTCYEPFAGKMIRLPADQADHPNRQALELRLAEFHAKNDGLSC